MDKEKLKKAFVDLEGLNINDELVYERAFMIFNSIGHLPVFISHIPAGKFIFRTRTHETPDLFKTIPDISITPRNYVREFARCNRPYQSIFYCSENRPTSFMELLEYWAATKKFGDKLWITIGRWQVLNDLNLIMVTSPDKSKRVSEFDKFHGDGYDLHLKDRSDEEKEFSAIFFEYMFEKFRKPAKNDLKTYVITTAYSNLALLQAKDLADGITYPSVPFGGQGTNMAVKESYLPNLKLTHAMWTEFEITPTEEGKHNFTESKSILTEKINYNSQTIEW